MYEWLLGEIPDRAGFGRRIGYPADSDALSNCHAHGNTASVSDTNSRPDTHSNADTDSRAHAADFGGARAVFTGK